MLIKTLPTSKKNNSFIFFIENTKKNVTFVKEKIDNVRVRYKIFFLLCCLYNYIEAQNSYPYGFSYSDGVVVLSQNGQQLQYPFAGGINGTQFALLDCNFDGVKDLVCFDVQGENIRIFLRKGNTWEYSPQYSRYFPQLHGFMQLHDFDKDGKEDIFTNSTAGIAVYKNISDNILKFELFTSRINSIYYENQNPINIFCTPADYVIIKDMDNDGDLEILSFGALGKYLEYHKNISMEKYGNCQHLEYQVLDRCWGKFSESGEDNQIILNDNCNYKSAFPTTKSFRHTGSSMLAMDFDNNGLQDLILGDMDFPFLFLLSNGGTADSTHFVSVDTLFPSQNVPVNLYSMPCPMLLNLSSDTIQDLLVSPIDLSLLKSENKASVWYYKNYGSTQIPDFRLITKSFLQEEMLDFGSGAIPILADINQDGLIDLLVGNYGYYDSAVKTPDNLTCFYSSSIAYLQNIGNEKNPVFQLITEDLCNLREMGYLSLYPAVADLNNDKKPDILLSDSRGKLLYLINNSTDSLHFIVDSTYFDTHIVEDTPVSREFSSIALSDIDKDGKIDMICGTQKGSLLYYQNIGTLEKPHFNLTTLQWGAIDKRNDCCDDFYGYATVAVKDSCLFVGSACGKIACYAISQQDTFVELIPELFVVDNNKGYSIKEGIRTSVSVADLDNDGYAEMIVGNFSGGLTYYKGIIPPQKNIDVDVKIVEKENVNEICFFPNPTYGQIQCSNIQKITKISIFNTIGQCVFESTDFNIWNNILNINNLKSGFYIICGKLKNGESFSQKIIKL